MKSGLVKVDGVRPSINGNPEILGQPSPSNLDLNGQTPANNYKNNAPIEGVGRI
jgi:hypothetical protein